MEMGNCWRSVLKIDVSSTFYHSSWARMHFGLLFIDTRIYMNIAYSYLPHMSVVCIRIQFVCVCQQSQLAPAAVEAKC